MTHAISSPLNSTTVRLYVAHFATRASVSLAAAIAPAWTARKAAQ